MKEYCAIKAFIKALITALIFFVALFTVLLLNGCKEVQYIPITQTEYRDRIVHDSIHVNHHSTDSVIIQQKGDTVFRDRWHTEYRDRWREKIVADTIYKNKEVPVPVERKMTKWEQFCLDYGKLTLGGTACAFIMAVGYIIIWLRRRRR